MYGICQPTVLDDEYVEMCMHLIILIIFAISQLSCAKN